MITESAYNARREALIASGVDERLAGIQAILDYGISQGNITSEEADVALAVFNSFLSSHPGFQFLSPRERYRTSEKESEVEAQMWNTVQPILDKAQGVE